MNFVARRKWNWTGAMVTSTLALLLLLPVLMMAGLPVLVAVTATCLHFIRFCFATIARADGVLHWTLITLIAFSCVQMVRVSVRAWRRGSDMLRELRTRQPRPDELLHALAVRHGILSHLRIIAGPAPNPAFTAGFWRPRVYLAGWLQQELSTSELEAVLLHEKHHLIRRDPMRSLVLWAVSDFFFWIPLVRYETAEAIASLEFAADDFARRVGELVLAGAILKLADRSHLLQAVASFITPSLVTRRVHRLLDAPVAEPRPDRRTLALSAAGISALWLIGVLSSGTHVSHTRGLDDLCPHEHQMQLLHSSH